MADPAQEVSFLDRPIARLCAVGVALLMVAALAFMHRDDLFPPETVESLSADDPVALCLADRAKDIDAMVTEGTISAEQGALFKSRAEALCQAQVGGGSGPPPPR